MKTILSRRRFISIAASAIASPAFAGATRAKWRGTALGAGASMRLEGIGPAAALPLFAAVEAEIRRLEAVFSLFQEGSSLCDLNRTGVLIAPPPELLAVLSLSDHLHEVTSGAFDPTIQPLWSLHASRAVAGERVSPDELTYGLAAKGWQHVEFDAREVRYRRPGMAMTLNGVAQGYITDRIARMLRGWGLRDVLIDMGEIAALGRRADGAAWRAAVALPAGALVHHVMLSDRALATSAPLGTVLDRSGKVGHILDPRTGLPVKSRKLVSISAETAALADGLSTGCVPLTSNETKRAVSRCPGAKLEKLI